MTVIYWQGNIHITFIK